MRPSHQGFRADNLVTAPLDNRLGGVQFKLPARKRLRQLCDLTFGCLGIANFFPEGPQQPGHCVGAH